MKLTALLRMKKPEGGDAVNVEDLNENFDILDEAIQKLEEFQGDVSNGIVHMDQASTRTNVANGDSLAVLFGKVMKWFSDLKSGAFADTVNNDTTADGGYVADARIVRTHGLEIDAIDTRVKNLETSFPGGCKIIADAITNEGVTTAETASPSTMAANIAKIRNGGDLTETKYVPSGKKWIAGKQTYTGTGTDRGEVTLKPTGNNTATGGAGYYSKVIADGTAAYSAGQAAGAAAAKVGTAGVAQVRKGYTFTNASTVGASGNMTELTGNARPTVKPSSTSQNIAFSEAGYCDGVKVDGSTVYANGETAGKAAVTLHKVTVGNPQCPADATTSTWSKTFTVEGVSLTAENFFLVVTQIDGTGYPNMTNWHHTYLNPTVSYNRSTGLVTVEGLYKNSSGNGGASEAKILGATLYCVYTKPARDFIYTK